MKPGDRVTYNGAPCEIDSITADGWCGVVFADGTVDEVRADDLKVTTPFRYALVDAEITQAEQLKRYMPDNYEIVGFTRTVGDKGHYLIAGRDVAGWTLDDYVIPRLASGMYYAAEIKPI